MTLISRSLFDTRRLPERARLRQWSDAATPVWDILSVDDEAFSAVVDLYHGGDLVFGTVSSSAQSTAREMARIAEDGIDYYAFQFYISGQRRAAARGDDVILRNGDLLTVDMTQPIATESTRYRSIDLGIPRRVLAPLLVAPDAHGGRRHDASQPLAGLVRAHVEALYRAAPHMTVAQMHAVQDATVALAAAALNGLVAEDQVEQVRAATLFAVKRYVEDWLHDMALSAAVVARHFSISRATLYRIMEPVGGFVSYLRLRRLHRVRADLANPARHHLSVGEIAETWGFASPSAFTKSFRQCFGMSPRAYRAMAADALAAEAEIDGEHAWSHWLAALK
ncbi:hypothetical protein WH87_15960 [Devosia epidermidihirudinis]|uniref:HTH araC/xylS-type domain-containing protein n=1 Tax=Devosia epidermidihirudinis TaxID=1293439 RepID=A0A0F5Q4M2_9HYPH|nr:AraC family transcriptional regulator [Devosia epidermidihirudinis]KKC35551.1 hypothetical protein WH87_15960 [Devosia epidermidihirudinis]